MDQRHDDREVEGASVLTTDRPAGAESDGRDSYYLIGDVAAVTGFSAATLRAWERAGLIQPRRSTTSRAFA
jgi:MerR family regulatory protein